MRTVNWSKCPCATDPGHGGRQDGAIREARDLGGTADHTSTRVAHGSWRGAAEAMRGGRASPLGRRLLGVAYHRRDDAGGHRAQITAKAASIHAGDGLRARADEGLAIHRERHDARHAVDLAPLARRARGGTIPAHIERLAPSLAARRVVGRRTRRDRRQRSRARPARRESWSTRRAPVAACATRQPGGVVAHVAAQRPPMVRSKGRARVAARRAAPPPSPRSVP